MNPGFVFKWTILVACSALTNIPLDAFSFGTVVAWGDTASVPANATNVIAISAGYYNQGYNTVLRADGTVVSWSDSSGVQVPVSVSNVVEVASGYYQGGLALKKDGKVFGWGSGNNADLTNLSNVVSIERDDLGSTCLLADGSVARVTFNGITYPLSLTNIVSLFPFNYGYIALRADGTYFVDSQGWLNASPSNNVMTLAAGGYRAGQGLLLRQDGSLVAWGNPTNAPPSGTNFVGVAASMYGKFVLRADGTVTGWSSAFGSDATTNFPSGLTNIIVIDGGESQVLALRMNRSLLPVSLSTALDTQALVVSSKGSSQWFAQTNVTQDGADATRSGPISHGTASSMRLWTNGPVNVSFWWKVSSETNKDVLTFSAGGVILTNISGESGWQQCTVTTPPGKQLLQWTYSKDAAGSTGQDAGWVDQISIAPANVTPPYIQTHPTPGPIHVQNNTIVTFSISATGTEPKFYSWYQDGIALPSATNSYLTLPGVTRTNSGTYHVVVTNQAGSATSSNSMLVVHTRQRLSTPSLQPDGTLVIDSHDADGGTFSSNALPYVEAFVSTNLMQWEPLPDALVFTNGVLKLHDAVTNSSRRFYRIRESW